MKHRFAIPAVFALVAATAVVLPAASAAAKELARQASPVAAPISPNGSWTTYHHDHAHTGYDSTRPAAGGASAGWVSPALDGAVYGEPLIYGGIVYVATLNNTVYALNQTDGSVVWSRNVGAPQTSGWACGNINPTGILGTGVIDTAASRVYFVGFLSQFASYYLFGWDLATGTRVLTTQIAPTGFDWTIQQQRGALAVSLDGTHVYAPFGGRAGDCGAYNGWVVGLPTAGGVADELYQTPSNAEGIWAPGGVVVDDATGNVFFATGNAIPCSGAITSDSVIRTNAALGATTFFQPVDWSSHWCGPDLDLGSASPTIISPTLAFTSGKYGQGFLIDPTNPGGTNGQVFPNRSPYLGADVCVGNHSNATFGSFAYAAPRVYLECNGNGIVSLTVDTVARSFSVCDAGCAAAGSWQAGGATTFGPPIVAGGIVWAVDINGGGLSGFDAATGAAVFQSAAFGVARFTTPSEAGGQIFVAADNVVRSFNMGNACTGLTSAAAPPTTATAGTAVTVTGSATGCASPLYEFWLLPPGGTWGMVQTYTSSPNYYWNTTGLSAGVYRFSVWVRDMSSSGTTGTPPNTYDAFSAFDFTLTIGGSTACAGMSTTAAPPNSATAGTAVTVTGSATVCPNPRYEFWLLPPGGTWAVVQPYSSSATFNWNTTGRAAGVYRFSAWARDAGSTGTNGIAPNTYDAFSAFNYTLMTTSCTGMSASAVPANSTPRGITVTVTGAATGCSSPLYQFWLLPPGGTWSVVQPYTSSANFSWTTTGLATGVYRFSVWARDASSSGTNGAPPFTYDAFSALNYTLTTATCTAMGTSTVPANSAPRGTTVTVTGSATGCPNGLYEFWLLPPGGTWTLVQTYTSSPNFYWNTTNKPAGVWRFSVWARDASSPGANGTPPNTYDVFSAFNYTVT